jgi:hypothetical protein
VPFGGARQDATTTTLEDSGAGAREVEAGSGRAGKGGGGRRGPCRGETRVDTRRRGAQWIQEMGGAARRRAQLELVGGGTGRRWER